MTIAQLIERARIERAKMAAQLHNLDAALAALSKIATAPTGPKARTGRTWTAEQKAKLSESLKKVFAAKKAAPKSLSKPKA